MAILETLELYKSRSGMWDYDKETYTRHWAVITDSYIYTAYSILSEMDAPPIGSVYQITDEDDEIVETAQGAYLASYDVVQDDESKTIWWVSAQYTTEVREAGPLDRPAKKSWRAVKYKKAVYKDVTNEAIVNSAGEPFLPPREIELHFWRLNYTINLASFDVYNDIDPYLDTTNNAIFKEWPIGTVKLSDVSGDEEYDRDGVTKYWRVTYVLDFKEDGWTEEILDKGLRYWDGGSYLSGNLVQYEDPPGTAKEALLDGDGFLLSSADDPWFIEFTLLYSSNLNELNIGDID